MKKKIEKLYISCSDGIIINASCFHALFNSNIVVLINNGSGKLQESYHDFASFLSNQGITTYTYNYRGMGNVMLSELKKSIISVSDWGQKDFSSILSYIKSLHIEDHIFILGHSIGGQIIGFSKLPTQVKGIILVAAQSGYYNLWSFPNNLLSFITWKFMIPSLTKLFSYFPGKKMGIMENLPPKMSLEWSKWCCSPNYLFDHVNHENLYFKDIKRPLLSLSFSDDLYAPHKAVQWLLKQYTSAEITDKHFTPRSCNTSSLGHSCLFERQHIYTLGPVIVNWIKSIANNE